MKKSLYLIKQLKYILSNFIPHETVTFDNIDPPWINSQVKQLINKKMLNKKKPSKIIKAINLPVLSESTKISNWKFEK